MLNWNTIQVKWFAVWVREQLRRIVFLVPTKLLKVDTTLIFFCSLFPTSAASDIDDAVTQKFSPSQYATEASRVHAQKKGNELNEHLPT